MDVLDDRRAGLHSGVWRLKVVPSGRYFMSSIVAPVVPPITTLIGAIPAEAPLQQ